MEMNYNHPEFGVWHLTETPIKTIPYGALIKWFDQVTQFGFHLGRGEIACVLAQDGKAVVFSEAAMRSEFQVGLYTTRQDFIFGCLGDDLATWGNFSVWIFDRYGKCFLHPVAPDAVYEGNIRE